jgi:hypothetical protein
MVSEVVGLETTLNLDNYTSTLQNGANDVTKGGTSDRQVRTDKIPGGRPSAKDESQYECLARRE